MIAAISELLTLPRGVRLALPEDVEDMAAKGKRFFDATILRGFIQYDVPSMVETIGGMVEHDDAVAFVMEDEDGIFGGIGGYLYPMYFNKNELAAQQVFWFVLPEKRSSKSMRLLQAWELWAKNRGAKTIWSGAKMDEHYDAMAAMMARRGYAALESVFIREV